MVAYRNADDRYRLSLGDVIDIGRPWADGSACDHLLVSLPLPFGRDLEWFKQDGQAIRFLWLVPITATEASLAREASVAALEDRLEQAEANVLDPNRPSVA
jgi:hypothetical protein